LPQNGQLRRRPGRLDGVITSFESLRRKVPRVGGLEPVAAASTRIGWGLSGNTTAFRARHSFVVGSFSEMILMHPLELVTLWPDILPDLVTVTSTIGTLELLIRVQETPRTGNN